jgi:hypothetical protein
MFEWLRRILLQSGKDERQQFYETIDDLNAKAHGGKPTLVTKYLGSLPIRSGALALTDPQYVPGLDVLNIASDRAEISATLWEYPSRAATVTALTLQFGDGESDCRRKIGEVPIDSAKIVIADKADLDEHWAEVGKDRIGVIPTALEGSVLHSLKRRFKLKTVHTNSTRAEVVGPVSEQLEQEIEAWVKSDPRRADFPYMYFRVQTNNSFDRALFLNKTWDFIPVGNEARPLMFVCETGRGDGTYDVECEYAANVPRILSIRFIDDEDFLRD